MVEDDDARFERLSGMIPSQYRVVRAADGNVALGVLNRDRDTYDGVMLDHDLGEVNGRQVVEALIGTHSRIKPAVLIHSTNDNYPP